MATTLDRRTFLGQATGWLGLLGLGGMLPYAAAQQPPDQSNRKPNFLFLFADDMTHDAIRALGNMEIHTPHLDRLAQSGTCFRNCYNQGGWHGAVCVASRAMLLTGRFLWKAANADAHMKKECAAGRLWPHYLQQAGYYTCMSGKWHVNCDAEDAFQSARHVRPGMPRDIPEQYDRPRPDVPDIFRPSDPALGGHFEGGKHWSEVLADDGVDFIHAAARQDAPFFMYLAFNAPHDPRQFPAEYGDLYPPDSIKTPNSFQPLYPDKEDIGCAPGLRDERLAPFPRTEQAVRAQRREYYAIISHLDAQIGRILDALEASGQREHTFIFFTADNGLAVGKHGLMGKQNMYEHSMKVPLMVAGPGIPADNRVDALVYLQDVMPTTLELAGVPLPEQVEFKSLMPLFQAPDAPHYDAIYGAYMNVQRMARVGKHKLIVYPKLNRMLLFDLDADPDEMHNLADLPEYETIRISLLETLRRLQQETGDKLAL